MSAKQTHIQFLVDILNKLNNPQDVKLRQKVQAALDKALNSL